jgi:hypothetical protein
MNAITIFAIAVGFVCACRLVFGIVEFFSKKTAHKPIKLGKRNDWYCFFHTLDLIGSQKR